MMRNIFRVALDALREGAQVVAAVAATLGSHAVAGDPGEGLQRTCLRRTQQCPVLWIADEKAEGRIDANKSKRNEPSASHLS